MGFIVFYLITMGKFTSFLSFDMLVHYRYLTVILSHYIIKFRKIFLPVTKCRKYGPLTNYIHHI